MADISQFNIPLPVEADSTVSRPESPKSDSDGALFEDMLVEAGAEATAASDSAEATAASNSTEATPTVSGEHVSETEPRLAPTAAFTTTAVPGVEGTPEVLLETLLNQNSAAGSLTADNLAGNLAHNELSEEVVSQLLARSTTDSQAIEQAVSAEIAKTATAEAVSKSEVPVGAPVNTVAGADTVVDPALAGNVEPSAMARNANVGLVEQPAVATARDPEQVLVRTNPDSGQVNREVANPRTAEFVPTTGSATPPTVVGTGVLNPFVQPGDGKSLKSLDLAALGVTRIEITAENTGSNQTPAGQVKVIAPEAVSQIALRPEPTLAMLGLRSSAEVSVNVSTAPGTQGQTTGNETVPVLDSVDNASAASQSSRPEVTTVSGAALEAQVTSQYVLKEGTTGRRNLADSKVVVAEATPNTTEKGSTASFVQMTSEIPAETGGTARQAAPQPAAPAQPAKPANLPTFSLEPARRVTMMLGESGNGVRVQLSENRGEVSVRFDAPTAIRTGLEGSVLNLVDSLNRQQVPLSEILFSGRFDTGTDSGQSQHGDGHGSRQGRSADAEAEEAIAFMTEFESSDEDSLVSLTA